MYLPPYSTARRFPMNQMPTLEVGDFVICQSNAITRFVARELSLYGANSQEHAIIDQVFETINDIANDLIKFVYGGFDDETKVSMLMFIFKPMLFILGLCGYYA